jgi:hypothetical protein
MVSHPSGGRPSYSRATSECVVRWLSLRDYETILADARRASVSRSAPSASRPSASGTSTRRRSLGASVKPRTSGPRATERPTRT